MPWYCNEIKTLLCITFYDLLTLREYWRWLMHFYGIPAACKCVQLELKCIYILVHVPNIFEKPKAIDLGSVFSLLLLQLCFQSKNCLWRNIAMPLQLVIIIYSVVHFFISFVLNLISPIRQFTYSILSIISSLGRYL